MERLLLIAAVLVLAGCDPRASTRGREQQKLNQEAAVLASLKADAAAKASEAKAAGDEIPPCCRVKEEPPVAIAAPQNAIAFKTDIQAIASASCCEDKPSGEVAAATQPAPNVSSPATQPAKTGNKHVGPWTDAKDRAKFRLDYQVADHNGKSFALKELVDRPMALTFIFTRCPNPNMCPLIASRVSMLQSDLRKAGLADKVRIGMMTYDVTYDTPERLKAYAGERNLDLADGSVVMLRPHPDDFASLMSELQISAGYAADGTINHFIELILIDRKGRFVRDYTGEIWKNAEVAADLERLAAE